MYFTVHFIHTAHTDTGMGSSAYYQIMQWQLSQKDTLVLRCLGQRLLKISPYIRMSGMSDDSNTGALNGLHCVTPASYRVLSGRNFKMG